MPPKTSRSETLILNKLFKTTLNILIINDDFVRDYTKLLLRIIIYFDQQNSHMSQGVAKTFVQLITTLLERSGGEGKKDLILESVKEVLQEKDFKIEKVSDLVGFFDTKGLLKEGLVYILPEFEQWKECLTILANKVGKQNSDLADAMRNAIEWVVKQDIIEELVLEQKEVEKRLNTLRRAKHKLPDIKLSNEEYIDEEQENEEQVKEELELDNACNLIGRVANFIHDKSTTDDILGLISNTTAAINSLPDEFKVEKTIMLSDLKFQQALLKRKEFSITSKEDVEQKKSIYQDAKKLFTESYKISAEIINELISNEEMSNSELLTSGLLQQAGIILEEKKLDDTMSRFTHRIERQFEQSLEMREEAKKSMENKGKEWFGRLKKVVKICLKNLWNILYYMKNTK